MANLMNMQHVDVVELRPVQYRGAWYTDLAIEYSHPDTGVRHRTSSRLNYLTTNTVIEQQSFVLRFNRYAKQGWMQ